MGEPSKWSTTFRPHFLPPVKSFDVDWPLMWTRLENPFNIIYTSLYKNIFLSLLDSIIGNWSKPIVRIYWNAKTKSPPLILSPFHSLNSCLSSSLDNRISARGSASKSCGDLFLLSFLFCLSARGFFVSCSTPLWGSHQPPATRHYQQQKPRRSHRK